MKKRKLWWLLALLACLAGFAWPAQPTQAAAGARFTISPVLTKNQVGMNNGYFNLLLQPNATETLAVNVTNLSDKKLQVRVTPTTAWTNSNIQIDYGPGAPKDSSASTILTKLMSSGQTVTLAPKATQRVSFTLRTPKAGLQGLVLGAIRAEDQKSYKQRTKGFAISNKFAMVLGVQVQTNKDLITKRLRLTGVKAGVQTNQAAVLATLNNPQPTILNRLQLKAKVMRRGETKALLTRSTTRNAMAPNSHATFAVFSRTALRPGKYTLDLVATNPGHRWHFKENFTITAAQATKINKQVHLKVKYQIPWLWLLIGLLILIILILLILLLKRRRKDDSPAGH